MFGFDKMFDFNRDGQLDSLERAVQFQFMDDMLKEDHSSSDFDEDEADVFGDAGLDYDELEFMDPDERREVKEANEVKYRNENGAYGAKTMRYMQIRYRHLC